MDLWIKFFCVTAGFVADVQGGSVRGFRAITGPADWRGTVHPSAFFEAPGIAGGEIGGGGGEFGIPLGGERALS